MVQKNTLKADYGQDVPGMVRDTLAMGTFLTVLGVLLRKWSQARESTTDPLISGLGLATTAIGVLSSLEGLALISGSRVGKFFIRDTLLKSLHLQGNETVLDVGCGHGMFLIGAAKCLPQGKAVGIDLWSQVDQGGNRKAATIANAEIEGVRNRVEVLDGDMRELPFASNSFDVVIACLSVHNIESPQGRRQAISEIVRVLKRGGRIALLDIFFVNEYPEMLRANGMQDVRVSGPNFLYYPPIRTVKARKG